MRLATLVLAIAVALAGCVSGKETPRSTRAQEAGYTVRQGDTLAAIAMRSGIQMSALARLNGIKPPYLIRVGQRLRLPPRSTSPQPRTASRPVIQPDATPTPAPRPAMPPVQTATAMLAGAPRLVWPADGPVGSTFGSGADPRGITLSTHAGVAVRSAAAGTVLFAGGEPQRYGQVVVVDHGGGWITAYANLARLTSVVGERVNSGTRLGFTGERGLHFELRRDNQPVDPLPRLPPRF